MRNPLPAHKRAEILVRVAGALGRRADEAARQIAAEAGKPLKAARVEVARAMSTYTMAAVEARKLAGEMVPMDASQAGEGKLAFTMRLPIGVVGAISPFNFPLNLVAHKIAPALAAGCAVVLKPASQTPLSALFLAELEHDAGLPPGLAERARRPVGRHRRRPRRGRARRADHVHRVGGRRVGHPRARAAQARQPRARERDPGDRRGRRRRRGRGGPLRRERVLVRGPEAASLVQRIFVQETVDDWFRDGVLSRVEALVVGDPAEEETDVGLADQRQRAKAGAGVGRRGARARWDQSRPAARWTASLSVLTRRREPSGDPDRACDEALGPVCMLESDGVAPKGDSRPRNATRDGSRPVPSTALTLKLTLSRGTVVRVGRRLTRNEAPTFVPTRFATGRVKATGYTCARPAEWGAP